MTEHHPSGRRFSDSTATSTYPQSRYPGVIWSRADAGETRELQRIRQRMHSDNRHRFPLFSTDTLIFLGVTVAVILFTVGLCYAVISTLNASPLMHG